MLCAVFLTGCSRSSSSSSSSTSADDLRFLLLGLERSAASGDERAPLSCPLEAESGLPAALCGEWYCRWGGMAMFLRRSRWAGVSVFWMLRRLSAWDAWASSVYAEARGALPAAVTKFGSLAGAVEDWR